jgi:radical SAM-linked protein
MIAYRYRIQFRKAHSLRFIGHLDLHRAWERTLRRAGLPIAFSEGFNPRARINIGQALPLGCSSQGDLLELWLAEQIEPHELQARLAESSPTGLEIEAAQTVQLNAPKLQRIIVGAEYEIEVSPPDRVGLKGRLSQLLGAKRLPRERRGKAYDLRPLIQNLTLQPDGRLVMSLVVRDGATGRPDEVLRALEISPEAYVPHRRRLLLRDEAL